MELREKLIPSTSAKIRIIRETQGQETNKFREIFPERKFSILFHKYTIYFSFTLIKLIKLAYAYLVQSNNFHLWK